MNAKPYVLQYLTARGKNPLPGKNETEQLAAWYLDAGVVDSMGIIDMVLEFESHFGVRFTPDHLQSVEFRTVGGLIRLIDGLAADKKT